MRRAQFNVSVELLREALHMPALATIVHASMSFDGRSVVIIADDPALPERPEPHKTMPTITREATKWDWGVAP